MCHSRTIINDDRIVIGDPHAADGGRKSFRLEKVCGSDESGFDISSWSKKIGAGNMGRVIFSFGIPVLSGKIPGCIEDTETGLAKSFLQPIG